MDNSFIIIMLIIILVLAMAIILLANVLLGAAQIKRDTDPEEEGDSYANGLARTASSSLRRRFGIPDPGADSESDGTKPPNAVAGLFLLTAVNGVSDTTFYMIFGVIFLEVLILLTLLYNVKILLGVHRKRTAKAGAEAAEKRPFINFWDKINRFRPIHEEVSLDTGHDYDGIKELDNRLPPWWLYGFYCTIAFAFIYLWRFHVAHTAPLSHEELVIDMRKAEIQKEEYLKKAASNVDENTVVLLTSEGDLAAGKAVFQSTCFACHGKAGEGGVGPNLTDNYWLHGGSIKDVFKTIKYGWPEKGMKSWKDDYSPSKIAQIASYVESLKGTNPANAKAPQGNLEK